MAEPIAEHPGRILFDLMKHEKLTQKDVAALMGIKQPQLSMICTGNGRITPKTALLLGAILKRDPLELITLQAKYDTQKILEDKKFAKRISSIERTIKGNSSQNK